LPNKKDLLQNKLKVSLYIMFAQALKGLYSRWNVIKRNILYHCHSSLTACSLQERKYFDSGDYALSKAGKASDVGVTQIGREHPVPENIPHSSTSPHNQHNGSISASPGTIPGQNLAGTLARGNSPVKEGSGLQRERSASDEDTEGDEEQGSANAKSRPVVVDK